MNEKRLCKSLDALMWFIDESFGIDRKDNNLNGFDFIVPLLESAAYNSYLENTSNKADTIHIRIKESLISMMENAYLSYVKRISDNISLSKKEVILAFDYTDEDFYGDVQGFDIHGWKRKDAVTGHFKFLTCSIISDEIPEKIPLISVPIKLGHRKSSVVKECLFSIKDYVGEIKLILFDRGFYDNDLMYELTKLKYPFLIFAKKLPEYKKFLEELEQGKTIVVHDYIVNKDKSNYEGENYLAFLKEIYDPRSEKNYDWIFATNVEKIALGNLIGTYKKRWRIETQFRVQDEARIRCKSTEMKIRYFFFLFEQMLQTIWMCFYKDETSFKEFIIELAKMSRKWTKTQKD